MVPMLDAKSSVRTATLRPAPERRLKPTWVWIDVSATCNLACELCYTIELQSVNKMSMATFTQIVDGLVDGGLQLVSVHLNWRGEPTSNRLLPEMIAYLASHGLPIEWHTNGTLISSRRAAQIVEATEHQVIYVSLDGGTAESFEATRGAGNWARALRGLEALLEARRGRSGPRLGIYQLDLGVPPADYDPRFRKLIDQVDDYQCVTPVEPDGAVVGSRSGLPRGPCFWLGNGLAFDWQGNAYSCLLATATPLGSILETDARELVDRASALREIVAFAGRRAVSGCRRCRKCEGTANDFVTAV